MKTYQPNFRTKIKAIFGLLLAIMLSVSSTSTLLVRADDESSAYPLSIKAFSAGYGDKKTGAFIELVNVSGQPSISLAGFSLRYTNTSGNRSNVIEFPEGSTMTGEYLLLRYRGAPDAALSDLQYTKIIAREAGPLELVYEGTVVTSVCWSGGKDCLSKFQDAPDAIVQDIQAKTYAHDPEYVPHYTEGREAYTPPSSGTSSDDTLPPKCQGVQFSEILTYYETDKSEQFIELYNSTDENINLTGCKLRYKKKKYDLSGTINASDYLIYTPQGFSLTKNPTSSNLLELLDTTDDVIATLEYPHGQKKTASYALFGYHADGSGNWLITYHSTPGAANIYQEYRNCPAGKVINQSTGNCVKASTMEATATECPAGKYRNPETGRCKKYETSTTSACKEGYERNPETNRCRKIKNNTGAAFSLLPETAEERTTFIAFSALAAIALVAVGYAIYQYRRELKRLGQKCISRLKRLIHRE